MTMGKLINGLRQDRHVVDIVCPDSIGHSLQTSQTNEALASGLTVIAFYYAGAMQHIENGHNGMLADFNSDNDYLLAAESIAKEPELVQSMRQQARLSVQGYEWSAIQHRLVNIYQDTCLKTKSHLQH